MARIGTFKINAMQAPIKKGVNSDSTQKNVAFAAEKFSNTQNTAMPNVIKSAMRNMFRRLSSMRSFTFCLNCF